MSSIKAEILRHVNTDINQHVVETPALVALAFIVCAGALLFAFLWPFLRKLPWTLFRMKRAIYMWRNREMIAEIRRTSTRDPRTFVSSFKRVKV